MTEESVPRPADQVAPELSLGKAIGFWACAVGVGLILAFCMYEWSLLFSLLAFAGMISGSVVGVLAAPLGEGEKERFGIFMKVISGFITGYLLSKIDPLITALSAIDPRTGIAVVADPQIAIRVLITFCSFGVSLATVFSVRAYWPKGLR